MKDPIRLSDDPTVSPDIRELLRGSGEAPPPMDPAAHAATSAALAKLGTAQVAATVSAKLVVVSLLVGVSLGAVAIMTEPGAEGHDAARPGDRSEAPAATTDVSDVPAAQPELPAALPVESPPPEEAESPAVEVAPRARRRVAPPANADRLTLEAALLERARLALAHDPRAALAQANRHAREYPHGQLGSARELIAIDALRRLHRDRQAIRRAEALIARDPNGIHAERARAILAELTASP